MKPEGGGQVIAFPGSRGQAPHKYGRTGNDNAVSLDRRLVGDAFISVLRSNVENAEKIAFGGGVGLRRDKRELDTSRQEGPLENGQFDMLINAVDVEPDLALTVAIPAGRDHSGQEPEFTTRVSNEFGSMSGTRRINGKLEMLSPIQQEKARPHERQPENLQPNPDFPTLPQQEGFLELPADGNSDHPHSVNQWRTAGFAQVISGGYEALLPRGATQLDQLGSDLALMLAQAVGDGTPSTGERSANGGTKKEGKPSDFPGDAPLLQGIEASAEVTESGPTPVFPEIGSAIRQIANNIRTAVAPAATGSATAVTEPVRTVRFKLQPENLGEVEVRIRMRGDSFDISIQLEKPEALRMMSVSQDDLKSMLGEHGLRVESIEVALGRAVRESGTAGQTDSSPQGGQGFSRQEQGGAADSSHGNRRGQPDWSQATNQDSKEDEKPLPESNARTPVRRDLYL